MSGFWPSYRCSHAVLFPRRLQQPSLRHQFASLNSVVWDHNGTFRHLDSPIRALDVGSKNKVLAEPNDSTLLLATLLKMKPAPPLQTTIGANTTCSELLPTSSLESQPPLIRQLFMLPPHPFLPRNQFWIFHHNAESSEALIAPCTRQSKLDCWMSVTCQFAAFFAVRTSFFGHLLSAR